MQQLAGAKPSQPGEVRVATPAGPRTFHHRGTRADLGVIAQTFGHRPENLAGPPRRIERLRQYSARIREAGKRPLILDLGANIGATALRLAALFPKAKVIAIEPHEGNAVLARRNTEGLDVEVRVAAIGAKPGEARIADPGSPEWAFRVSASGAGPAVPVTTIPALIEEAEAAGFAPFILKCDVEGAEESLFDSDSSWFDDFAMVSCEPHDWMLPRRMTINGFLRAHLRTPRQLLLDGENLVSLALPPPKA